MGRTNLQIVDAFAADRRRIASSARRQRKGSVIVSVITMLITMLIVMVIFCSVYFIKQLQANRKGTRLRAAQRVEKKESVQDQHRWPSPDKRLAFKIPSMLQMIQQPITLVEHQTGKVLAKYKGTGRLFHIKWREDSRACAIEQNLSSGRSRVWLLLIDGDNVTRCRPADVIDTDRFLPDGDQGLPHRWEHSVGVLGFREDGDLQIDWVGTATLMDHGRPVRTTRAVCQFKIHFTPAGKLSLVETFPMGRPKVVAR